MYSLSSHSETGNPTHHLTTSMRSGIFTIPQTEYLTHLLTLAVERTITNTALNGNTL